MKKQILIPIMILFISVVFSLISCMIPGPKINYPTPANNSRIFSNTVTLFWDHLNTFEFFEIWLGDSPEELSELATVTVNHYTVEDLEWGKTYYWKIVGFKTVKNSVESSIWQFAVGNPHQALLLGITDYDSASDLNLTDDDAQNMQTAFEATVFNYQMNTLTGRVVKADIQHALENVQGLNEEAVFTFFYAGHGGYANNESYLYLSNGYRLYMSELRTMLQQLPGKKLVIIDACQSGNFTQLNPGRDFRQLAKIESDLFNASVLRTFSTVARNGEPEFYVMTGANIYQSSWENTALQNGVFSFFLLDGIGDVGIDNPEQSFDFTFDADLNSDGAVTMSEAYTYAAPKVEQFINDLNGFHQSIQVFPQESDFVISQW
ncbi:MAG TPA: caspase family protein [Thermotogota bacterium]|nr:caspase family protein [Thermotogota bacterium]HRW35466.1 caspase family protein [Thermotogota bacterium]